MKKLNCWEFKRCGRGPSAKNECAAARDRAFDGMHEGINAGRACWVAAGTGGESSPSGMYAVTLRDCLRCDFFKHVQAEEQASATGFSVTRLGMLKILEARKAAQDASGRPPAGAVDLGLRDEFAQEVNKVMSGKQNGGGDLASEFAREVERLSSQQGKNGA